MAHSRFSEDYSYTDRVASFISMKEQEDKTKTNAELDFATSANDTEKELCKTQGYFIAAVIAFMFSLLGNFMQYLAGHAGQL
jgi:N-methylhydantoinase B/oxoprolinase/acetone carboxylase alpha subunit